MPHVSSPRAQQHATRAAFFMPGFAMAAWAPIVPFAKQRAGLDEAALGLVLLCLGAGSLLAMPLTGMLATRMGYRRVMLIALALICMALPLLQNSWVFPLLFTVPLLGVLLLWLRPDWRQRVLDRLPAFREARLAQTANAAELLLHGGLPLPEALALLADFQPANRLRDELLAWRNNIAAGVKRFSAVAAGSRYVPPLFIWLVWKERKQWI